MTATLYCFGESGNAYKAALTMQLAGYVWTPRFVDFFGGETRTPAFRALNPMGEVPVLVDGDLTLSQSGAIQFHVAQATGRLGGATRGEQAEVLRWVLWDNHKLSSQAGMTRFLMNFLPPEKRPEPVIAFMQGRLKAAYDTLNRHMDVRGWIVGDAPTIADCACAGYLFYPEPFGFDRADWPHIDAWLTRLAAQPGWKHPYDLMPGRPSDRAAT
jgi:glutathione S-transferase